MLARISNSYLYQILEMRATAGNRWIKTLMQCIQHTPMQFQTKGRMAQASLCGGGSWCPSDLYPTATSNRSGGTDWWKLLAITSGRKPIGTGGTDRFFQYWLLVEPVPNRSLAVAAQESTRLWFRPTKWNALFFIALMLWYLCIVVPWYLSVDILDLI